MPYSLIHDQFGGTTRGLECGDHCLRLLQGHQRIRIAVNEWKRDRRPPLPYRLVEHVWRGLLELETMPTWHRTSLIPFAVAVQLRNNGSVSRRAIIGVTHRNDLA